MRSNSVTRFVHRVGYGAVTIRRERVRRNGIISLQIQTVFVEDVLFACAHGTFAAAVTYALLVIANGAAINILAATVVAVFAAAMVASSARLVLSVLWIVCPRTVIVSEQGGVAMCGRAFVGTSKWVMRHREGTPSITKWRVRIIRPGALLGSNVRLAVATISVGACEVVVQVVRAGPDCDHNSFADGEQFGLPTSVEKQAVYTTACPLY